MKELRQDLPSIILNTKPANIVKYHPLDDLTGTTAKDRGPNSSDGTYVGPTLKSMRTVDGRPAPDFDGINDNVQLNANLATLHPTSGIGSFNAVVKPRNIGVWTDTLVAFIFQFRIDGDNSVEISKRGSNNTIRWFLKFNGVSFSFTDNTTRDADWFWIAITWDDVANEKKAYFNGTLLDTQAVTQDFVGTADDYKVGSTIGDTTFWNGSIAHPCLWDIVLTQTEIEYIHSHGYKAIAV